ncbi:MAG: HypC/HybG/HupF family hydrogenase formation chaperone [Pseudomonadota bacterium]|nr:HypC/HybG/HupF family hydrogenase formation chaperone [Pseudomonadota bacterium]
MCLAIPMKVVEIDDFMARCEAKGIMRDVTLFMLQHEDIKPGDYVVVHTGYAIQKMTEHEARSAWEVYDEMLDLEAEQHKIGITPDV